MPPFDYPPEYRHVEQLVRETNERIQQIEQEIENLPPDQDGWNPPAPRPPGTPPPANRPSRDQIIAAYRGLQEVERENAFKEVEKASDNADPKMRRQIRDSARENLFGNEYKDMHRDEFEAAKSEEKDFEQSGNYMDAQLGKEPEQEPEPSNPQPDGPDGPHDPDPDQGPDGTNKPQQEPPTPAMLASYSISFNMPLKQDGVSKGMIGQKEPQQEKTLSPSEQANQTLRGRYEPTKAENVPDKSPTPEKDDGPDLDR